MITNIIRYHTAIYYILSITRDRFPPYWVSSSECNKHSIINMLKKTNFPLGAKKRCNKKQYDTAIPISWGSHPRTHTHDMDNKQVTSVNPNRGVGSLSRLIIQQNVEVASCYLLVFFVPNGKFVFFSVFIIECLLQPPDETQQGRNRSRVINMM